MLEVLLAVIVGYFLYKILRFFFGVHRLVKQQQRAAREFFNGFGGDSGQARQSTDEAATPKAKTKKIDRNVGEYVDFEDIASTPAGEDSRQSGTVKYPEEQQVVDAEWEDLK